jgi:hypothetical protein
MGIRQLLASTLIASGGLMALGMVGCSGARPINCEVVKLQREGGLNETEIAAGFAVSESEIARCAKPGATVGTFAPAPAPAPAAADASGAPAGSAPADGGAAPAAPSSGGGSPY